MKRKGHWDALERLMASKRNKGSSKENGCKKVPLSIMVQCMSSPPTDRQKKYEPLNTRDVVDFSDYDEITIENVRDASFMMHQKAHVTFC